MNIGFKLTKENILFIMIKICEGSSLCREGGRFFCLSEAAGVLMAVIMFRAGIIRRLLSVGIKYYLEGGQMR